MTLTLIDRVRHVQRGGILVLLGTKGLALATELRRRWNKKTELARLSPRDLQDIVLTAGDVQSGRARLHAQDAATKLHYIAHLRCGDW